MILFSLKHGWHFIRATREARTFPPRNQPSIPGAYGSTVGLVSMGVSARTLRKLLNSFDVSVIAYDPFLSPAEAKALNVRLLPLDQLFRQSDVVSIHTPLLPETRGLITGHHIAAMKNGATFINTARGDVVRQTELVDVVTARSDLQVILDVTSPEPPAPDCALFDLPNVIITPHIAGSLDRECRRMGHVMVEELRRFVAGQPLLWSISPELAARTSHRPLAKPARVAV
jgi:phosphoglycerate dehydrogenase-like enzyme